jgi:hypothetical protein
MGRVTPGNPPCSRRKFVARAYLRAAQAYMLISMPTGTSTILGAFQAILALLEMKPDVLRPADKLIHIEKFASRIFSYIALHNNFAGP